MSQASKPPMAWGVFARRISAILIWLFASQALGAMAADDSLPMAIRAAAAGLATIPVLIWFAASRRKLARPDPAGAVSIAGSMVSGALWAILFVPGFVALMAFAASPGSTVEDPFQDLAIVMLCSQAPGAALVGQLGAQYSRWRSHKTLARE